MAVSGAVTSPTPGEIANLTGTLRNLSQRITAGEQIPDNELTDWNARKNEMLNRINDTEENTQ